MEDVVNPTLLRVDDPGRPLPSDHAAEESIVSAMMLSQEVLEQAVIELDGSMFHDPACRAMFEAIRSMFDEGRPVDPVSLADALRIGGDLERVGGPTRMLDLVNAPFAVMSYRSNADIVERDASLREMILASAQISAMAYDAPDDMSEVSRHVERLLETVAGDSRRRTSVTIGDAVADLYSDLVEQADHPRAMGVPTGYSTLDDAIMGMRPGQMIVFGARPGVGKTSLCLNLAMNAAEAGTTVMLFSLEMSSQEIAQRLLAAKSMVPLSRIRTATVEAGQWEAIVEASEELSGLPIVIDDTPGTNVTEVRAKARRALRGCDDGMVILDYLQLLGSTGSRDSRATQVGEMSRGMKVMAKELGVPVIALSQLNREVEGRGDNRPRLSDLRESGSIEQDADVVVLLDRALTPEDAARPERPDEGVTRLIVAKNRSGPLCTVDLGFDAPTMRFVELPKRLF